MLQKPHFEEGGEEDVDFVVDWINSQKWSSEESRKFILATVLNGMENSLGRGSLNYWREREGLPLIEGRGELRPLRPEEEPELFPISDEDKALAKKAPAKKASAKKTAGRKAPTKKAAKKAPARASARKAPPQKAATRKGAAKKR